MIVDEFGKGTLAEVGVSLLVAAVDYWTARAAAGGCPHLLVCSHFHSLVELLRVKEPIVAFKVRQ